MWISNAGFADIFTVFAKCEVPTNPNAGPGGLVEKLTAFLVEKGTPGFTIGKEEHKLGIRGSSTCPLILSNCVIPAANLLGEVGKGHHIAFNILNVGRYKLGIAAVGGARMNLGNGIRYAKDRKAFGKPISDFGLIQEKIADCAVGVFVGEALCYRTVGLIDGALAQVDKHDTAAIQKAIEGYAVECSIVKVWASEMLDHVVDEMVQIYGGYGYVEEYPAERAYRDSRVNRIFEGTNEINRLIITGWLMKSAMSGKLALMPAIKSLMDEVMAGPSPKEDREGPLAAEYELLAQAKKLTLFAAGSATQKYMTKLADEQEVMGAIADMIIEVFAMESAILRAEKMSAGKGSGDTDRHGPHLHRHRLREDRTRRPQDHRRRSRGRHAAHPAHHPPPPLQARRRRHHRAPPPGRPARHPGREVRPIDAKNRYINSRTASHKRTMQSNAQNGIFYCHSSNPL